MAFGETEGMQAESDAEIGKKAVRVTPMWCVHFLLLRVAPGLSLTGTAILGSSVFAGEGKNSCFGGKSLGIPTNFCIFRGS